MWNEAHTVHRFFPLFDSYIYALLTDLVSIRLATISVLQSFLDDGVRYLELRTTPRAVPASSISKEDYISAVLGCIKHFTSDTDGAMKTYLILSIDRRNTAQEALETVDLAIKWMEKGVIGVDLCGNPLKGDVSVFEDAFQKAKAAGLKVTLHFAEVPTSSSEQELQKLLSFGPDRLGHVCHVPMHIREEIVKRKIGVELCLSCNVLAKLTPGGFEEHHFGYWIKTACPVILCVSWASCRSSITNALLMRSDRRCWRVFQPSFK